MVHNTFYAFAGSIWDSQLSNEEIERQLVGLLRRGAWISEVSSRSGRGPVSACLWSAHDLLPASAERASFLCCWLIKHGADLRTADYWGNNILHHWVEVLDAALRRPSKRVLEALLDILRCMARRTNDGIPSWMNIKGKAPFVMLAEIETGETQLFESVMAETVALFLKMGGSARRPSAEDNPVRSAKTGVMKRLLAPHDY